MHCVWSKAGGIDFPSLITAICALNEVAWALNEEVGVPMRLIDAGLIAEFLGNVPPTKRSFAIAGASSSSLTLRAQNVHTCLDHIDQVLDYHGK